jgi:thiol-disulfide isomerase/thioredoxin
VPARAFWHHSIAAGQHWPISARSRLNQNHLTDGSLMDTADFNGQPMWINFMTTWCPQCAVELPMM